MFEKVNSAYEFLCSRSAKNSDQPDANNIVLILRTQSILFCRYSQELHPYKYAGYPMLIKTIQMETDDEKLFSKSAPLLAAASGKSIKIYFKIHKKNSISFLKYILQFSQPS